MGQCWAVNESQEERMQVVVVVMSMFQYELGLPAEWDGD